MPLVLEARGLDVTPEMIRRFERGGDRASAEVLQLMYADEIRHVAVGCRWFTQLCARRRLQPAATYQELVRRHSKGSLKPPFNRVGRDRAGLSAAFYEPLAARQPRIDQPTA